MLNALRESPQVLVVLIIVVTRGMPGLAQYEEGSTPVESTLKMAVLQRPPYTTAASGMLTDIEDAGILTELQSWCPSLYDKLTIKQVSTEHEMNTLIKTNQTDFAFPYIEPNDKKAKFKREFLPLMVHPVLDLLVIPKELNPGEVCLKTLGDSWLLLPLSVILTGMAGIVIWVLETINNPDEFPVSFTRGSWEGFWWAFISMTTVGYGDRCPRSVAGRCFAIIWIFTGLIIVAVFMANITTALTSITVKYDYKLKDMEIGVLKNSTEETIAKNRGAGTQGYTTTHDMIDALSRDDVQGILIDRYVVGYHMKKIKTTLPELVLPLSIQMEKYEIGVSVVTKAASYMLEQYCYSDSEYYEKLLETIKDYMHDNYGKKVRHQLKAPSSMQTKSFNVFAKSEEFLKNATYISLGVLVAMLLLGAFVEMIVRKKIPMQKGHDVKLFTNVELVQEIAKGKEVLTQLQTILQGLEEKVNMKEVAEQDNQLCLTIDKNKVHT